MHLAGLVSVRAADLALEHHIPHRGIAHAGARPILIRYAFWQRRKFHLKPAGIELAQLAHGRELAHHRITRHLLHAPLRIPTLAPGAAFAVLQQDAGQRMNVQLGVRFADRFIPVAPSPTEVHLLAHHVGLPLHKLIDVGKDVLLHGVAPVDVASEFAVHLVPRPARLLREPAPEGCKILVEPFTAGVALLHADLAGLILVVAMAARAAVGEAPATGALHDHLEHVLTHGRTPRTEVHPVQ